MTATVRYRKPPELARLGRRHAVVEASAGTGKTYVLEHLVVELLVVHDARLEEILVVTFTEKATADLIHRVRKKLQELKDLGPEDPRAQAARDAPDDDCWIIDDRARRKLQAALFAFDGAPISTIHGFCQRLLIDNAFLQQRLFDEEVVDESEAFHFAFTQALRHDVVRDSALQACLSGYLKGGGDLEKLEGVLRTCHRALGTLHPPRQALRPGPVDEPGLQAAFAAWPMDAAGIDAVKQGLKRAKVNGGTIKAVGERLTDVAKAVQRYRDTGLLMPLLGDLDAIDAGGDKNKLRYLRDKLSQAEGDPVVLPVHRAAVAIDRLAVPALAAVAYLFLPPVQARLQTHKRERGLFDFQDMLTLVARAVDGDGPRQRELLTTLRAQYRFALIDEFQDTDEVQWHIFRRIFLDAEADGAGRRVLTVIGDPKQAIYSFRGADVHTYLDACAQLAAAGNDCLYLTTNFRSRGPLIGAYNAILDGCAPEGQRFFRADGGIRYDHPVTCGRPDLTLVDNQGDELPAVVVLDITTSESKLYIWQVKRALLGYMVDEIRGLLSDAGRLRLRDGVIDEPVGARDIFVLTRTNREGREIGEALRAARLPFAYFKSEKLFTTVEAREVLDLLRAIADPDDATLRSRAWVTAFFGLSLPDLVACDDLPVSHPVLRLLHEWKALADAGEFERLFARIVEDSGIACREVFLNQSERALTNYLHVLELLQEDAARTRGTVRELAQTLGAYINGTRRPPRQNGDMQRLETDGAAVQIMTIHQAKGLEAAVVFLYGALWPGPRGDVQALHEGAAGRVVHVGRMTPEARTASDHERDDEERRALYVALTRARGRLYLPRLPAAFDSGRGAYRFVNDRLRTILDGETAPSVRALFDRRPVACPVPVLADVRDVTASLSAWRPSPSLLADDPPDPEFASIAAHRAGFVTTSYTAVKRRQGPYVPDDMTVAQPAGSDADGDPVELTVAPSTAGELPRGRLSGTFLHDLLEKIPLESLAGFSSVDAWRAQPAVRALFERMARRHDRNPAHLPSAARLVYTALTAPVRAGDTIIPGLSRADHICREMEFLYPIPERGQPLLSTPASDPRHWKIERGAVKGFIDLLFQHDGLAYVCDWKGDALAAWDGPRMAAHCQRNYSVQARIYTLALLRLLGITDKANYDSRFGGVLYCFLRGMDPADSSAGIYFHRPAWDEVLSWETAMLGSTFWGLP